MKVKEISITTYIEFYNTLKSGIDAPPPDYLFYSPLIQRTWQEVENKKIHTFYNNT